MYAPWVNIFRWSALPAWLIGLSSLAFLQDEAEKKQDPPKTADKDVWTACEADFEYHDTHIFVSVMMNGRGPFRFAFDNGYEWASITPETQRKTGAGKGQADTLKIGNKTIKGGTYTVGMVVPGTDGMIASEHTRNYVVTIDYPKRKIYFMDRKVFAAERDKIKNPKFIKAEKAGPFIVITATLDGKGPYRFCHDTGTNGGFILLPGTGKKAGFKSDKNNIKSAQVELKDGGKLEWANTTVHVINHPGIANYGSKYRYQGTVGNAPFENDRVTLDYEKEQIIVWERTGGKK